MKKRILIGVIALGVVGGIVANGNEVSKKEAKEEFYKKIEVINKKLDNPKSSEEYNQSLKDLDKVVEEGKSQGLGNPREDITKDVLIEYVSSTKGGVLDSKQAYLSGSDEDKKELKLLDKKISILEKFESQLIKSNENDTVTFYDKYLQLVDKMDKMSIDNSKNIELEKEMESILSK